MAAAAAARVLDPAAVAVAAAAAGSAPFLVPSLDLYSFSYNFSTPPWQVSVVGGLAIGVLSFSSFIKICNESITSIGCNAYSVL
uniref:Putative secreted peptide n=1 Tax=Anopheles braziliensis TaxID=58242 RepID=A0A2M3ZPD0_9DIPT